MDMYAGKDWIVIWRDNVRGGYDRVEGSIGRSYDEIKGVAMSMSRNFLMLDEITIGEKVEKLDCLSIARSSKNWIVWVSPRSSTWILKSPVMMNSWGVVAAWERNDENWLWKVEKGWEYGDGGGGR